MLRTTLLALVAAIVCVLLVLGAIDPEIPLISKVGGVALWAMLFASGVPHSFNRARFESLVPQTPVGERDGVASFDLAFTLSADDALITPFRLFVPLNVTAPNLVLFIHGGGYFLVHADDTSQDEFARRLALQTGSIVLSLEYRLAPEHPFPASLDDARRFFRFAIDPTRPAPFLCRTELRRCADDLQAVKNREHLLRVQHPLALNVLPDFFATVGSSAGANLVLGASLSLQAMQADHITMRCIHTELMAPYLGVTEAEARAQRDWILHESLLEFAVKVVGNSTLDAEFMDPVRNNVDLGQFEAVRISAGKKELGVASMRRLCNAFGNKCTFATYDAVHGFVSMGKLGGHTAHQARQDTFAAIRNAFRGARRRGTQE